MSNIKLFESKKIRSLWSEEEQKWYFSVVDLVVVLTENENLTDYLKKLRKRDTKLGSYIGTNCLQIKMLTEENYKSLSQKESKKIKERRK